MSRFRALFFWLALSAVLSVPVAAAAVSPLLAWRQPIYIIAGFADIIAMALLLVQPLMAGDYLPNLSARRARWLHRWVGGTLIVAIIIHVTGLWFISPPDVVDALLLRSPTWFSVWGVVSMWAVFATALLFIQRHKLRPRTWRWAHSGLAIIIVAGSVAHAMLIDGTMETLSKAFICFAVIAATVKLIIDRRVWASPPTTLSRTRTLY